MVMGFYWVFNYFLQRVNGGLVWPRNGKLWFHHETIEHSFLCFISSQKDLLLFSSSLCMEIVMALDCKLYGGLVFGHFPLLEGVDIWGVFYGYLSSIGSKWCLLSLNCETKQSSVGRDFQSKTHGAIIIFGWVNSVWWVYYEELSCKCTSII